MELLSGNFVCPTILEYWKKQKKIEFLQWTHENYTVKIAKRENLNVQNIQQYVDFIIPWIYELTRKWLPQKKVPTFIEVTLFLTPIVKEFAPESKCGSIGACNCNGGYTSMSDYRSKTEVVVFREQDWSKVLIHELLHAFEWEKDLSNKPVYIPEWINNSTKKINVRFGEAFVEAWAVILHGWCLGLPLKVEQDWSLHRAQMLYTKRPWKETTSVFSYYIVKAAILRPNVVCCLFKFLTGETTISWSDWCMKQVNSKSFMDELEKTKDYNHHPSLAMTVTHVNT